MAKMSIEAKIAYYEEQLQKLRAKQAESDLRDDIEAGDEVVFKHGRGDTKKTLRGTVVGVKDDTNGRWVAITAGEGFDLERYTVRVAAIVTNYTSDERMLAAKKSVSALEAKLSRPARAVEPDDPLASE